MKVIFLSTFKFSVRFSVHCVYLLAKQGFSPGRAHSLVGNSDSRMVLVMYSETCNHRGALEAWGGGRWPLSGVSMEESR